MNSHTDSLLDLCKQVRRDIVTMTAEAGSGHPGGSMSAVELVVGLYGEKLRHHPAEPTWPDRDRFILSKGHVAPLLYSILAQTGYFPVEELKTLRKLGSRLQGHPNMHTLPGLECSSGSLGQGLSIANGLAMAGKLDGRNYRCYCLMGDGEIQEGQIWEAAMSSAHYKLDNICGLLDSNGLQIDGPVEEVMGLEPLADKWRSFGWHVIEIDGHDMNQVLHAYDEAAGTKGKPSIIIAKTVKGKGVSFMENRAEWHSKVPNKEELAKAMAELA